MTQTSRDDSQTSRDDLLSSIPVKWKQKYHVGLESGTSKIFFFNPFLIFFICYVIFYYKSPINISYYDLLIILHLRYQSYVNLMQLWNILCLTSKTTVMSACDTE